jgi:hypothetical protein
MKDSEKRYLSSFGYSKKKELASTNLKPRNELRREVPQLISGFMSEVNLALQYHQSRDGYCVAQDTT